MTVDTKQIIKNALDALKEIFLEEGRFRVRFHFGDFANLVNAIRLLTPNELATVQKELREDRVRAETNITEAIRNVLVVLKLKKLSEPIVVTITGYTPFNDGDECEHHFNLELTPDDRPSYSAYQDGKYEKFGITFEEYQYKFNNNRGNAIAEAFMQLQDMFKLQLGTNWKVEFTILENGELGIINFSHYDPSY